MFSISAALIIPYLDSQPYFKENDCIDHIKEGDISGRWTAVVLAAAVLAGFVFCLPDLLIASHRRFYQRHFPEAVAQWPLGGRFTALSPLDDSDANSYAGRVNEASRHAWPLDPNIKENKSRRLAMTDPLSFMFLGALKRVAGDISRGWLLARGVCGFLWLSTFYLLLVEISGRRRAALAWAVFFTLFYELFADVLWPLAEIPQNGIRILPALRYAVVHAFWLLGNYQANFGASRLVSPGLNHPPFFLACYAAIRAARDRSWFWSAAAGILGAVVLYIHPDLWPVYMAALGLYCVLRSVQQRRVAWPLWAALALAVALSLPWVRVNYPVDPDILARSGGQFTRAPSLAGLIFLGAAAACWPRRKSPAAAFTLCVFLAIVVAVESQLLTGYTIRIMRFVYLGVAFGFVAALGLLADRFSESRRWLWLTAALFILAGGRTISYAAQRYPYQGLPRDLQAAFEFLDRSTPEDSVVVALGPQETLLIPVYTHAKTMIGTAYNVTCDIPTAEQFARIILAARFYGLSAGTLADKLSGPKLQGPAWEQDWNRALWGGQVDWQGREWRGFYDTYGGDSPREEFVARLRALEGKPVALAAAADYLWVGPLERGLMSAKALKALGRPVYENQTISLYKVGA